MSLKQIARETLAIIEAGSYQTPRGSTVALRGWIEAAVAGTRLYTPAQAQALLELPRDGGAAPLCSVSSERTQGAARRLVCEEGRDDLVLLNFASARNPGGGFLSGAKAQEEDLTRASALYPCLLTQPDYYAANRRETSLLYTDHLIYSPGVPFFRTPGGDLAEQAFRAAVITAPAPNAGELLRRGTSLGEIETTLRRRAGLVLAVAAAQGHRDLVLGAWGCGVFRNQPAMVADAFASWLEGRLAGCFARVCFAIHDRSRGQATLRAFQRRFPG